VSHPRTAAVVTPNLVPASLAFVVGAVVAIQARVNGDLAERLGGGFPGGALAAGLSTVAGLTALLAYVAVAPTARRGMASLTSALRSHSLAWWQCLGGLCGALLILSQTASVPTIGVAVFTVTVVAGQTASGLVVDRVGLGPAGRQPVTAMRVVASVIAVAAVVLSVSGRFGTAAFAPGLLLLCLVGGAAVSVQSALNAQVGRAVASAVAAATLSFALGLAALVVVVGGILLGGHRYPALPTEWWLYVGGVFGALFVAVVAAVVPRAGVLVVTLATVAGQVVGAVLLDAFAPTAGQPLQLVTVLGAAATVGAVLLAVRSGR
jgi:bacterial/archaeal transporter family-2 protein